MAIAEQFRIDPGTEMIPTPPIQLPAFDLDQFAMHHHILIGCSTRSKPLAFDPVRTSVEPLKPFVPEPLDPSQIVGREIDEWIPYAGTYGMGGPGFLGFRIGDDWMIVAIWGAGHWFRLDGRLLTDMFWERHERSMPWQAVPNVDFQNLFVGRRFTALEVTRESVTARFDNGQVLTLSPDPGDRPPHRGKRRTKRCRSRRRSSPGDLFGSDSRTLDRLAPYPLTPG